MLPQAPLPPTKPEAAVGFSKTVTNTHAAILATDYECYGVLIQSSSKDDSNAAVTGVMYVEINDVKAFELIQGEEVFVPCSNTSQIKVVTQTGTAWVRGFVYRAPHF